MRQRLGDREAPRRRLEVVAEQRERGLVAGPWLLAQRRLDGVQPAPVMLDQGPGAADGIGDRLAVAGQREPRRELDRALERLEVVGERVGPARGPEADGR